MIIEIYSIKSAVAFVLNIFSTEKFNQRENVAFATNVPAVSDVALSLEYVCAPYSILRVMRGSFF
jgi:hypothetical protein